MSRWVFLGWTSTKQGIMCLAQGHNAMTQVRLKPATPGSRLKHSTTELPFKKLLRTVRAFHLILKKSVQKTSTWSCSKICIKRPISKIREHSVILSIFIKLPVVIETFVLSIFEWPFYTGFTVLFFSKFTLGSAHIIAFLASSDSSAKQNGLILGPTECFSDLDPKLFDSMILFLKGFFEKAHFEKSQQMRTKAWKNYPAYKVIILLYWCILYISSTYWYFKQGEKNSTDKTMKNRDFGAKYRPFPISKWAKTS